MWTRTAFSPACLIAVVCLTPSIAVAQGNRPPRVQVTAGGGFLTSGAYFTGPGHLALDNSDAFTGLVQVIVPVRPFVRLVAGGAYASPTWRLSGIPLVGSIGVDGASLWFADAAVRGEVPIRRTGSPGPTAFAQAGVGVAHFALSTAVLDRAVDGSATNLALSLGAGLGVPLTRRVGLELLAKDYIVSFKSVHELDALGIQGRRTHTFVLALSARVEL